jgi:hypothetical protein
MNKSCESDPCENKPTINQTAMSSMTPTSRVNTAIQIGKYKYPRPNQKRYNEREQKARLNYMASRIRAILCEYMEDKEPVSQEEQGLELWWMTGLVNEMVMYKT